MKLSTSTGDFSHYVKTVPEKVRCFRDTKFQYINLELGCPPAFTSENDGEWRIYAEELRAAAEDAGVTYVLAHAPCLHDAVVAALDDPDDVLYRHNVRAIRRAIEVCHALDIPKIVIHACFAPEFDEATLYRYNKMFYAEFFDLTEKYGITVLTENWDHDKTYLATGKQLRALVDAIGHPSLGICWDTAHGNLAESSRALGQYQNIIDIGDKLGALHISDNFGDVHHHSWPFAGIINFDQILQGLIDVGFDGYFNFEASYTLLHHNNPPYRREAWERDGKTVTTLLDPSITLKQKATDLLYDIGQYILESYGCFEE